MRFARMTLIALLALSLAACGGQTAAPAATTMPTSVVSPTPCDCGDNERPTGLITAVPTLEEPTTAPAAAPTTAPTTVDATATRTFKIVPAQTEVSYAVQETFLRQNLPFRAVGKTSEVNGEFSFRMDGKPTGQVSKITVDISTLKSDDERRDNRIREEWLESARFPVAEFSSTEVIDGPESYTEGQEVSFKLAGNLKIRDITKPVTFDVKGKVDGDTVTGVATAEIMMKDFGFEPPQIGGFVAVTDGVTVTINFTAKEG